MLGLWLGFAACGPSATAPMPAVARSAVRAEPAYPLQGWALRRADGTPFGDDDWRGGWSIAFVGYTSCPDVCPSTLQTLAGALPQLPEVRVRFIAVDPDRDEARLADYLTFFEPRIEGLTGAKDALAHAVDNLGASFAPSASTVGWFDHSTSLFVVNPDAHVVGFVLRPSDPARVVADVRALQRTASHGE